jgi:hypothetical protein
MGLRCWEGRRGDERDRMPTNGASCGCAARGMAGLSEAKPGWAQQLDLATFDRSRPGCSRLVQLFGSLGKGLADLGIHPDDAAACEFLDLDPAEVRTGLALISARLP